MLKKVNMPPKVKKGLKITANVLFWIFFALALAMTIFAFTAKSSATGAPQFGDKVLLSVKSDSMKDTFKTNDIIICKIPKDNAELSSYQKDDVVVFELEIEPGNKQNVAHRIVSVIDTGSGVEYQTKGDNNEVVDGGYRMAGDIKAKWTGKKLTVLGPIISFLQTSVGFLCCIVLPLCIFFVYEVVQLVLLIVKMKNKNKPAISAEQEEAIKQKAIEEFLKKQNESNDSSENENK